MTILSMRTHSQKVSCMQKLRPTCETDFESVNGTACLFVIIRVYLSKTNKSVLWCIKKHHIHVNKIGPMILLEAHGLLMSFKSLLKTH